MKHLAIIALATFMMGCDAPKKPETAPDPMAGMEMTAEAPAVAAGPSITVGDITVSNAWAPVTPVGARVAAGYFTLKNAGSADDKLLTIASPRAKSAELHEMTEEKGMMTMRAVPALVLKPGQEVSLEPGHLHLMLIDPALPFLDAETLPVTLTFEKAGKVEIQLLVRPRDVSASKHGAH